MGWYLGVIEKLHNDNCIIYTYTYIQEKKYMVLQKYSLIHNINVGLNN